MSETKPARIAHPADGMTADIDCGDGARMCIQNPAHAQSLSWSLTWATNLQPFRLVAASVLGSYDYLLSDEISMAEATRRLRLLRAERRALLSAKHD